MARGGSKKTADQKQCTEMRQKKGMVGGKPKERLPEEKRACKEDHRVRKKSSGKKKKKNRTEERGKKSWEEGGVKDGGRGKHIEAPYLPALSPFVLADFNRDEGRGGRKKKKKSSGLG